MKKFSVSFGAIAVLTVLFCSTQVAEASSDFSPVPTTRAERGLAAPLVINCALRWFDAPDNSARDSCRYMKSLFIVDYYKAMHGDTSAQELMWSYLHVGVSDGVRYDPVLGCAFGMEAYSFPGMTLPAFLSAHFIKCAQMPDVLAVDAGLHAEIAYLTAHSNNSDQYAPISAAK